MRETLTAQIVHRIVDYIRDNNLPAGHHLPAQDLADRFRVSRAPVSAALRELGEARIVYSEPNRGYFVADAHAAGFTPAPPPDPDTVEDDDRLYLQIAEDRLAGRLPDKISENELMRRYEVPRRRLQRLLAQIVEEGWVERRPGRGWEFGSTLSTGEAYANAYQFRASIEAEGLLQPNFAADAATLETLRRQQLALLGGDIFTVTSAELFSINANLHETIVAWSNNSFFLDAIRRVNRLRRLVEYTATRERARLKKQCAEHLKLLDLIEAGALAEASDLMRSHVSAAWQAKKDAAAAALKR